MEGQCSGIRQAQLLMMNFIKTNVDAGIRQAQLLMMKFIRTNVGNPMPRLYAAFLEALTAAN